MQLIFVLFNFVLITESSNVSRLVGSSVNLDIKHRVPKFDHLSWVFNKTNSVLKYYTHSKKIIQSSAYEDRVEFNNETYSLTLKNLQKTDSGEYEAEADGDEVIVAVNYRLFVLDPVEAPDLNHQLSNDTCNITLTCRSHDLSINSSCYKETCEEKNVASPGGVTLSLSVSGSTIICNHSNSVSWANITLDTGNILVGLGCVCLLQIFTFQYKLCYLPVVNSGEYPSTSI
uniref:Immunoglobulin domain-containing protein n=1 Tax=Pygocentrus nattereri TaxID=42514 RepID=A0A3B4BPA5_PYGNA